MNTFRFLPSRTFPTAHPEPSTPPDVQSLRLLAPHRVFMLGPYSTAPAHLVSLPSGEHYISETVVGPVISFLYPFAKERDGRLELGPGDISHQRGFWAADLSASWSATPELRSCYASLIRVVKRHLTRRKILSTLWIGHAAFALLQEHTAIILNRGSWVELDGTFVRSNLERA